MIARRTPQEIECIRSSCQIVFLVQKVIEGAIGPGISTLELDALAEETIRAHGAVPAFKGYRGFPASICASINAETVHGIPGATRLREGDAISVDVGVLLDEYYGDGAFTIGLGQIDDEMQHLLDTTRACLDIGIQQARAGNRISDISHAIQTHAEAGGLSVVREFGGHGIGRALHEEPHILNYGPPGKGPRLRPGHVIAIEPILCTGNGKVVLGADQWTATTRDGTPAAHFEHTIAIAEEGPQILTLPMAASIPAAEPNLEHHNHPQPLKP
jgi:methionyl aminopeptidase